MNAPEKIYRTTTYLNNIGGQTMWRRQPVARAENIEYVRVDAFINKLECWLNERGHEYYGEFDEGFLIEFNNSKEAIEDFRKYIKEKKYGTE